MNWRRGIVFAAIHTVIAGSLLVWQESKTWRYIRNDWNHPVPLPVTAPDSDPALGPNFNPCEGWIWDGPLSPTEQILSLANLPIEIVTEGHRPCNTPTRLDRMVQSRYHKTRNSEILILLFLGSMIAAQWFLIGAFPLDLNNRWWLEPGALITLSIPVAVALTFVPDWLLPPLVPLLAPALWIYWLVCLVRRLLDRRLKLPKFRSAN